MVAEPSVIDVEDVSDLARLVDDVEESQMIRVLRRKGREVAVIVPLKSGTQEQPRADAESARELGGLDAAFGGWAGLIDVDKFLEEIYAARDLDDSQPVEL